MQGVKDWHMVVMVVLITGVGIILLTISTAFLRHNLTLLYSEEYGIKAYIGLYRYAYLERGELSPKGVTKHWTGMDWTGILE